MMANGASFELTLNRFGLRFMERDAERAYGDWRNDRNLPLIRLTCGVSIPAWLTAPLPGHIWWPGSDWFGGFWAGYAISVPALILPIAASYSQFRRMATLLTAFALAVLGSTLLWILTVALAPALGIDTTGPAVGYMILMASFAIFMRLPPLMAAAAIAPFLGATAALVVHRAHANIIQTIYQYPYLVSLSHVYFFVSMISVVGERFLRRAFVNEQLLARQTVALETSRDLIRRYVPPTLAQRIIDGRLDGVEVPQRRRVTILFSDVVGFTEMADRVEPETLTQVIGEYMSAMAEIVDIHRGTVNEFIGDGLMAMFGAPVELDPEAQALHAVRAAEAMHARLPDLNRRWRKLGLGGDLQIRVGINTGMASVGSYGAEGRMTYTALGLQTNIAARIQAVCEPGGILLSEATWHLVQEEIPCESRGSIECKGVHFPVTVYAPRIVEDAPRIDSAARV